MRSRAILRNYLNKTRADFSYLTFFLQFVRPTRSSYIRIHRSDGKVVFSVDVAITAAVLYPVGSLGRTIEFTTSVRFTEKETYYVTMDSGKYESFVKLTGEAILHRLAMPFYYVTKILNTAGTNFSMAFKLLYLSPTYEIATQVLADVNNTEKRGMNGKLHIKCQQN